MQMIKHFIRTLTWVILGWAIQDLDHPHWRVRQLAQEHLQKWVWVSWPIFDYAKSEEAKFRISLIRIPTVRGIKCWIVLSDMPAQELAKYIDKHGNTWDDVISDGLFPSGGPYMPYPTKAVIQNIRRDNK